MNTNTTILKKYLPIEGSVKELRIEAYYSKGSGFVMTANTVTRSNTGSGFTSELYEDIMNGIYKKVMPCSRISDKAKREAYLMANAQMQEVINTAQGRFNIKVIVPKEVAAVERM